MPQVIIKDSNACFTGEVEITILDNLISNNIEIRYNCKVGICGGCKFKLIRGDVKSKADFCLSGQEYSDGIRLACCSSFTDAVTEILIQY